MKDVQILGLIVSIVALICGTILVWKQIDSKRKTEDAKYAAIRASHDKVFDDNTWAMYESERSARIQAETREGIKAEQLRKERAKNARLELILKKANVRYVAE
jgi:hypothetical protein